MSWSGDLKKVHDEYKHQGMQLNTHMYNCWSQRRFPFGAWEAFKKLRFFSATTRLGIKKGHAWQAAALEGFANGAQDAGFSISATVHGSMGVPLVSQYATQTAKKKYLKQIELGNQIIAFSSTEAVNGGTDAFNPGCILELQNGSYYLEGKKWNITNTPYADLFLVWCRDTSTNTIVVAIVERDFLGVNIQAPFSLSGARTSPTASVSFSQVHIPKENIIRFKNSKHAMIELLTGERILTAFPCKGLISVMIEKTSAFARTRKTRNGFVGDFQYIQKRLTDMELAKIKVDCMSELILSKYLKGCASYEEVSALKMEATNYAHFCAGEAISTCASYGIQDAAQFHMIEADTRCARIGGGTEEAHRLIIWSAMKRKYRLEKARPLWVDHQIPHPFHQTSTETTSPIFKLAVG